MQNLICLNGMHQYPKTFSIPLWAMVKFAELSKVHIFADYGKQTDFIK